MDKTLIDKIVSETLAIEAEDAKRAGALGFMARALVQATMPHSKPESTVFERRNGAFSLAIMAHPRVGLPYGSLPRLLMVWVTTEAVKTKNPVLVLGSTLSDFMEQLNLVPTGGRWGSITRLREQMTRLFASSISCLYQDDQRDQILNLNIADNANLWWNPKEPEQAALWKSTVTVGKLFFDEVTSNPIPIDLRALKTIKHSPMAIDIYCWLTYRMSYLKSPSQIPWEALKAQFGAGYGDTKQGKYDFKRHLLRQLKTVLSIYKEANVEQTEIGLLLKPSKPHIKSLRHK